MSKIFEYVIFYQLFDYMCTNNLLTIEQFGFRTGHSTELAAIKTNRCYFLVVFRPCYCNVLASSGCDCHTID